MNYLYRTLSFCLRLTPEGVVFEAFKFDRRGYAEQEIEAMFAKYDVDGDRVLDLDEQRALNRQLEGEMV